MGTEKRTHSRFPVKLRVVLDLAGRGVEARSRDLSLGGMFVEGAAPVPYGTVLTLDLYLPALDTPARMRCVVRWNVSDGMGVAFGPLRAAEAWAINQLAALHTPRS